MVKDCTIVPTKPEEAFRQFQCTGYVGGVLDAYGVVSSLYPNVKVYCVSGEGISIDAAVNALVQWVRIHPENAALPSRSAILLSLKERNIRAIDKPPLLTSTSTQMREKLRTG